MNVEMQVLSLWVQVLSQNVQVDLHISDRSCTLRLPDVLDISSNCDIFIQLVAYKYRSKLLEKCKVDMVAFLMYAEWLSC